MSSHLPHTPATSAKNTLRKSMTQQRAAHKQDEREASGLKLQKSLMESTLWQQAQHVALYVSTNEEAPTHALLEHAWETGKHVLLPRCLAGSKGKMEFVPCHGWHELAIGSFDLLEPTGTVALTKNDAVHTPDVFILPGLAFDMRGARLGYGGGYYDQYIHQYHLHATPRIGLAFHFQIVATIPLEPWDIPVNALCTEKGLLWIP